ncbi:hypothetical protein ACSBR2_023233 [Camellia fascicularis]
MAYFIPLTTTSVEWSIIMPLSSPDSLARLSCFLVFLTFHRMTPWLVGLCWTCTRLTQLSKPSQH